MQITSSNANRADRTREKILDAAVRQFSEYGLAGARTEALSKAAGVNKALLYYYFKNKSGLYSAALQHAAARIMEDTLASLRPDASPGENLLRLVLNHFDRISTQREFQSLMQQEMVRFHRGESDVMPIIARSLFAPMLKKMESLICDSMRDAELCDGDWMQVLYAGLGANVFYFLSAPVMRTAIPATIPLDPLDPVALDFRRRAAMEFLGNALFRDRSHGARLARRILAETQISQATAKIPARPKKLAPARRCS